MPKQLASTQVCQVLRECVHRMLPNDHRLIKVDPRSELENTQCIIEDGQEHIKMQEVPEENKLPT